MKNDLDVIKYKYGESMMKLCRIYLFKLLDTPGLLPKLLEETFHRNKNLANDIIAQKKELEFQAFMLFKGISVENEETIYVNTNETAEALLDKAGYILYPECKNEADIQSFRHYYYRGDGKDVTYEPRKRIETHYGDELCTFNGGRLSSCRVWFAVKKDAENYKREDFKEPQRQDAYSTSVISIQFSKNEYCTLSIKSRYNHNAYNSDNTFNSNLDNIIAGLTDAFERDFGVRDKRAEKGPSLELDGYVRAKNGKFYPYNQEIKGIYYCPDNIIIDNMKVKKLPTHQILAEYFIIDCKKHTISLYDKSLRDSFAVEYATNKKILIEKDGIINITKNDGSVAVLKLNKKKQIISFQDENLWKCGDCFLQYNQIISILNVSNLRECGDNFLENNMSLRNAQFQNLEKCGNNFLYKNVILDEINVSRLIECGWGFLHYNNALQELNLSALEKSGSELLFKNNTLKSIFLPKLKKVGAMCLFNNNTLEVLDLPSLEICGDRFLSSNKNIKNFNALNLKECGHMFLCRGGQLISINLPLLKECGQRFMFEQKTVRELNLPSLQKMGINFLRFNSNMKKVNVSKTIKKYWKESGCSEIKVKLTTLKKQLHKLFKGRDIN